MTIAIERAVTFSRSLFFSSLSCPIWWKQCLLCISRLSCILPSDRVVCCVIYSKNRTKKSRRVQRVTGCAYEGQLITGFSRNPSSSTSDIFGISIESSREEKVSFFLLASLTIKEYRRGYSLIRSNRIDESDR